jgi:hypothetical protein
MMPWRRAAARRGAAIGEPGGSPSRANTADLSGLAVGYLVGSTAGGTGRHVRMRADGGAARGATVTMYGSVNPGGRPPGPPDAGSAR